MTTTADLPSPASLLRLHTHTLEHDGNNIIYSGTPHGGRGSQSAVEEDVSLSIQDRTTTAVVTNQELSIKQKRKVLKVYRFVAVWVFIA